MIKMLADQIKKQKEQEEKDRKKHQSKSTDWIRNLNKKQENKQ